MASSNFAPREAAMSWSLLKSLGPFSEMGFNWGLRRWIPDKPIYPLNKGIDTLKYRGLNIFGFRSIPSLRGIGLSGYALEHKPMRPSRTPTDSKASGL